ncbi:MAG TPA: ATP-binding protein [Bacteroidales bacterium]|nr:ATP-binding protein [Bacteroidales bacterium]
MIQRLFENIIVKNSGKKKAIIILGARQVGKSTLLNMLLKNMKNDILFWDGDEPDLRQKLDNVTSTQLKAMIGSSKILVIDEAQRIKNIGITLKLITDKIKDVQLYVSGSSSLELSNEINEPLTGRKYEFFLMPFSTQELINHHGVTDEKRLLQHRLIYGFYPDIVCNPGDETINLKNLVNSYLYKDIFNFNDVRKPEIIQKLLKALALQISSEVSYHELAQTAGCNIETVQRYIDLLEKSFIIFRLSSFNRNLRNELKKSRKIYFFDNGVRNALLGEYKDIELRSDSGALWENFLISERQKYLEYNQITTSNYFWRTKQQQEIDYIEERDGKLFAYEFKWRQGKEAYFAKTFRNAYPNCTTKTITPENYLDFLL